MIRLLSRKIWLLGAGLVILLAALLSVARMLTPYTADYHDRIEARVGELVGQRIEVGAISAVWRGFGPRLQLHDIELIDAQTGRLLVHFAKGEVGIDLLTSLLSGSWHIDRLIVSGVRLSVIRDADGGFTVAGIEVPTGQIDPAAGTDQLLAWLLAQGRLAVDEAEVSWIDRRNEKESELRFSDVSLEMRNAGARHQLTGSARLPTLIGQQFSFAIDVQGDLLAPEGWDARAYVEGVGLHLPAVLQGTGVAGLNLDRGDAGVSLWGEWERGRLTKLEGILSAFDLGVVRAAQDDTLSAAAPRLVVDVVTGRFAWRRQHDGWRVDVNDFMLTRQGRQWPASDFGLRYVRAAADGPGSLRLHAGYLDLSDTAGFLALSDLPTPRETELLRQLDPRGRLRDLDLAFTGGVGSGPYAVRVRFEDLTTSPWEKVPGVQGFDGTLAADDLTGGVDLDTTGAELLFPRLFRGPLPVSTLQGRLQWAHTADGWQVEAPQLVLRNEDADLHAWGGLELPATGAAPTLALFGAFQAATVENTSRYLPVDIMPESAVQWLDRAIGGGTVPRGTLLFYGPVDAFPFDNGDGRFVVDFDVQEGVLDYATDWPLLDQIEANVVFDGRRMAIHAVDGRSLSSMLTAADVRITDLSSHAAVLEVEGKTQGPTHDVLRYLRESPLREKFGAYVAGFEASGDSRLDLTLAIPLHEVAATTVAGRLQIDDSRLATVGGGFDIAHIRGDLRFTEAGLQAQGVEAEILGLPSRLDIVSEGGVTGTVTKVTAAGRTDVEALAHLVPASVLGRLHGDFPWQAELHIPGHTETGTPAELRIGADLTATAIDLPVPLGKASGEPLALQITDTVPHTPERPLRLQWGEILSGVFELDEDRVPRRGELRVGGGVAELPPGQGLRIAGRLERLSYEDWADAYAGFAAGQLSADDGPEIGALDLEIGTAEFHGHAIHQAHIAAERKSPGWELQVASEELQGRIVIPTDQRLPWTMDLDHLYITALAEAEAADSTIDTDPRELPAMRIRSQDFKYNTIAFGSLDLAASRGEGGLHLDRLLLSSRHMRIDAKGDWRVTAAGQSSAFAIKFDSGDFGAALTQLGYADTIDEGQGHFDINARWEGSPTDFALERLDGSVRMKVTDGRLLDVEPGAGRIFGLLSLQALPRRLSLDFSDFFRKGFSFDRIEGNFAIRDGGASTRDLSMEGPAGKVAVNGKIDLAARTYDQTVVVTPSVAAGLPVAGAVAGGVGVGAVILLMEKVFKPNIERMTRVTYRVTGDWADPVVERQQGAERSDKR